MGHRGPHEHAGADADTLEQATLRPPEGLGGHLVGWERVLSNAALLWSIAIVGLLIAGWVAGGDPYVGFLSWAWIPWVCAMFAVGSSYVWRTKVYPLLQADQTCR